MIALCTIQWWDEVKEDMATDRIAMSEIKSFGEAAEKINAYYGDTAEIVTVELYDYDFVPLNDEIFEQIRRNQL